MSMGLDISCGGRLCFHPWELERNHVCEQRSVIGDTRVAGCQQADITTADFQHRQAPKPGLAHPRGTRPQRVSDVSSLSRASGHETRERLMVSRRRAGKLAKRVVERLVQSNWTWPRRVDFLDCVSW